MRILVHDFSGHPFQMHLSRELARRGHEVLHVDCASYSTGKGDLSTHEGETNLQVRSIDLGQKFDKYSARRRFMQEYDYGRRFTRIAAEFRPDVVLSSNDPLLAKWISGRWCRRTKTPWVFWLQDIYSVAMSNLVKSIPVAGKPIGAGFRSIERRLLHQASAVVPISADFLPLLQEWKVDPDKTFVIENWAPLEEIPESPRHNAWSAAHGLDDATVFLYSGTLGLKHDPELLVELARRFRDRPEVRVVVASEGVGADHVRKAAVAEHLDNVVVLPFQSFDVFPEALATGDVLVVILEPEAGVFSVPSKVLSYHCAGRALLASVPAENLAARIVRDNKSGIVVTPGDRNAWADAAAELLDDADARSALRRERALLRRADLRHHRDRRSVRAGAAASAAAGAQGDALEVGVPAQAGSPAVEHRVRLLGRAHEPGSQQVLRTEAHEVGLGDVDRDVELLTQHVQLVRCDRELLVGTEARDPVPADEVGAGPQQRAAAPVVLVEVADATVAGHGP